MTRPPHTAVEGAPVVPRDSVDAIVEGWREVRDDLDVEPIGIVTRLSRVRSAIEHAMDAVLAESGLTAATFSALAAISRLEGEDGVTQVRLMDALQLTSGTVSVRIGRLVADGLAERRRDPGDRRGTRIVLTARGRDAFEAAAPAHLANERRLLASLGPDQQDTLAALLRRLLVDLEGLADPAGDPGRRLGLTWVPAHRTAQMRASVGLPARPGLLVRSVERDGPADRAGVRSGDLIAAAGGREVRSVLDLHEAVASASGVRGLAVGLVRGEREISATVSPAG